MTTPFTFREEEAPRFKFRTAGFMALARSASALVVHRECAHFPGQRGRGAVAAGPKSGTGAGADFPVPGRTRGPGRTRRPEISFGRQPNRKSQPKEERPPDNNDPISRGDTFELEKPSEAQQAVSPPPVPPQQESVPEDATPAEPKEVELEKPLDEPLERDKPVESAEKGSVPLDPGAPKPYRRLTESEIADAKKKARQEMTDLSFRQNKARETRQYDNPNGRSAPALGMSVETSRDDLGDYLKVLQQLVKGNWRIPNIARFEVSGVTIVSFKIHQNGKFSEARIMTNSGYEPLDTSALNAILNTYQAPPLPKHVDEEWIPIRFAFYYNMRPRY